MHYSPFQHSLTWAIFISQNHGITNVKFPGTEFIEVRGFIEDDLKKFREYINCSGYTAFEFAKADAACKIE